MDRRAGLEMGYRIDRDHWEQISKIHKNFMMVEDMKRNLQTLGKKLDLIDNMLMQDAGEGKSPPPSPKSR